MMLPQKFVIITFLRMYGQWALGEENTQLALDVLSKIKELRDAGIAISPWEYIFFAQTYLSTGQNDLAGLDLKEAVSSEEYRGTKFHESAAKLFHALGDSGSAKSQERLRDDIVAFEQMIDSRRKEEKERFRQEVGLRLKNSQPVLLHFGCANTILEGFINIDYTTSRELFTNNVAYNRNDYFIFDLGPLGIPNNVVDYIFHEDFIEHIPQSTQIKFLAETFRVLKAGAVHRVSSPDLVGQMARLSQFENGWEGVWNYEWDAWEHISLFTKSQLADVAKAIGYSSLLFTGKNGSTSPYRCKESRPWKDREEHENIFADLIK